jgi:predicted nucleic acid-binding protein
MILVDTSVWVDHLRQGAPTLVQLLLQTQVATHPFVVGELACGNLRNRQTVLELLAALPGSKVAMDAEVMHFIETQSLMGKGIGYIDAHLCASAMLSGFKLWTRDKRLQGIAQTLGCAWGEHLH